MKRLVYFTVLSIIIHLAFRSGVFTLAHYVEVQQKQPIPLEVTLVEQKPTKKKKTFSDVVPIKQPKADPSQIINDDSMARFSSEKTQRVRQETQATRLGITQNASRKTAQQKVEVSPSEDDLPEFARTKSTSSSHTTVKESSTSVVFPRDVKFSDVTNLNTDANIYYSFYSRVQDLYYIRWSERLLQHWNRLDYTFKKEYLAGRNWFTTVEVTLTSTGEYYSSKILQASGYPSFDEAVIFSFKDARFFPNPPRAKVEPDGFVRLRYRFVVQIGS